MSTIVINGEDVWISRDRALPHGRRDPRQEIREVLRRTAVEVGTQLGDQAAYGATVAVPVGSGAYDVVTVSASTDDGLMNAVALVTAGRPGSEVAFWMPEASEVT